jgi:hypothetical protein
MKKHTIALKKLNACSEAIEFGSKFPTLQAAWDKCKRGDWMLWYAGKKSGEPESAKRKKLVLAACACARLALPYTKDPCVLACIETAEKWAGGKATIGELWLARNAVYAADAAAYAVYAADAATYAADAAYAAAANAYADARRKLLKQCADIMRKHYPKVPR